MHPSSTQTASRGALSDWSLSAVAAGFLAVLISYAGPLVIFFQAAQAAHVPDAMVASWVWAISIGAAVSGIYASWRWKAPVVTAWSAPGTALLVSLFPGLSLNEAVGAYITAAVVILLIGVSGTFDRLMRLIPKGIAAGMMAGILFQFGTHAFAAASAMPVLAFSMIAIYVVGRRWWPRYCIVVVLLAGIALAITLGLTHFDRVTLEFTHPVFIAPHWALSSTLSLAIPLAVVSLTGQFLPGMAVLRGSGYDIPAKPIMTATSVASISVAFFGGITIVIAAITAALCTGKDAHDDPSRRYVAGIANGVFYLIGGTFAGAIVMLFAALPKPFVAILAGLALIGAIASNVMGAIEDGEHREASIITFLATASGLTLFGLGSAFWGIVIGSAAALVLRPAQR
ncbi:Inner membrane protein ydcO [Ralstonia pickettii]|jgi:benzoate membrane transport protein|uniref:benzoate/H(+) symporter BenE family transporter n=1 Tax=Ralstonia TaxID=48736 RepID=UPI0001E69565|nr:MULTISPECIES: benzoate/H(+) symporter BenE family transporter [Ralstonia]EFP64781.1 type III secretion protein SepZ [Ralstonia pickettii]EGY62386.1 benzoate transporter [Ralstonia sp. 5_2_56FAA]KFL23407.1 benzoate transporter family protein [Ralstonia pickettii]MBU6523907.1 benzoate/H(+) symporter BenE family transporter [Ralstonia sp. B265]NPT51698.1 benzoate/H(+) symporter BenE family transporter [Ralstonia sp. 3N]